MASNSPAQTPPPTLPRDNFVQAVMEFTREDTFEGALAAYVALHYAYKGDDLLNRAVRLREVRIAQRQSFFPAGVAVLYDEEPVHSVEGFHNALTAPPPNTKPSGSKKSPMVGKLDKLGKETRSGYTIVPGGNLHLRNEAGTRRA